VLRRGDFSFSQVSLGCHLPVLRRGRPPLSSRAAWGPAWPGDPAWLPRELRAHQHLCPPNPCAWPLAQPRHGIRFSTLHRFLCVWGRYLLPILPISCSDAGGSGSGETPQWFVLEGALFMLGSQVPAELGSCIPALGVCTPLKRDLSPKWIVLGWVIASLSQLNA